MNRPDFQGAERYALDRLAAELPAGLCYHCLAHTRDEVLPAAERLARLERLDGDERRLLRVAACFHDLGFLERSAGHEVVGARMAAYILPGYGLTRRQVLEVESMILATRLPQTPFTLVQAVLADADLAVLGRDDFMRRSRDLRDELAAAGTHFSEPDWYHRQLRFLCEHRYFTRAARRLGDPGKQRNIRLLRELLAAGPGARPGPGPRPGTGLAMEP